MEDNKKRVVKTIQYQTVVADKKSEKIYTVTVQFLEVSEEEARTKQGIIETILKREYQQRMFK